MEFQNLLLFVQLMMFLAITAPMYYRIPLNHNAVDLFLDTRNKQGLAIMSVLSFRLIDLFLMAFGDLIRINTGTCMIAEQLMLILPAWILLLELNLLIFGGLPKSKRHTALQYAALILPVLLAIPAGFYTMFEYTPTNYRALCTFISPAAAISPGIWAASLVRLAFSLWIPAHACLIINFKRNRWNLLTHMMVAVCLTLYFPELYNLLHPSPHSSVNASTARTCILFLLSVYLNMSVAGSLKKENV